MTPRGGPISKVQTGVTPGLTQVPFSYGKGLQFSPYRTFTREEWARLRADTPMTLKPSELEELGITWIVLHQVANERDCLAGMTQ